MSETEPVEVAVRHLLPGGVPTVTRFAVPVGVLPAWQAPVALRAVVAGRTLYWRTDGVEMLRQANLQPSGGLLEIDDSGVHDVPEREQRRWGRAVTALTLVDGSLWEPCGMPALVVRSDGRVSLEDGGIVLRGRRPGAVAVPVWRTDWVRELLILLGSDAVCPQVEVLDGGLLPEVRVPELPEVAVRLREAARLAGQAHVLEQVWACGTQELERLRDDIDALVAMTRREGARTR